MPLPPDSPRKTLVLWNPKAGRADEAREARDYLLEHASVQLHHTESNAHAGDLAREAASKGFGRVVAAGGDGTINAVVNGLVKAGGNIELAVLPVGTANDFAFSLAIPNDLLEAAQLSLGNNLRPIDLVEFHTDRETRYFANVAAGGNSDAVTRCLTDEIKERWGALCYLRGAIEVLTDLESFHATVQFGPEEPPFEIDLWNVIVANGRTNGGRLRVAPRASLEDGLIDVVLIREGTTADLAGLMTRFIASDYLDSDQVVFRQVREMMIRSQPQMRYSFDGEHIDDQPVRFRCAPAALRMIVGPDYLATPGGDGPQQLSVPT